MLRFAFAAVVALGLFVAFAVIGCGDDSSTNGDGSADATTSDVPRSCVADFPCSQLWACEDSTHWIALETLSCDHVCAQPCSGETCGAVDAGGQACAPGLLCIDSGALVPPTFTGPFCALGGVYGCEPTDAGAAPDAIAQAAVKQPGSCTDVEVEQFWSRCFDPATLDETSCMYWTNKYAACATCLAPTLEYVVAQGNAQVFTTFPNVSGCYATLDGTSVQGSCADRASQTIQCALAACATGCDLHPDAFVACVAAARKTVCAALPTCEADASASFATCEAPALKDFYLGFGKALCSGP